MLYLEFSLTKKGEGLSCHIPVMVYRILGNFNGEMVIIPVLKYFT